MMPSASGSTSTFSLPAMLARCAHQHVGIDPAQVETLAARQHRHRDFADFGGGEHEFGVLRRLLQRLQEGVEGRRRQHVDFVDDVDLVARAGRRVAHAVVDLADVVDAGMGRGVHFQHVHVPAFHDRLAMHAQAPACGWSAPSPSRPAVRNSARGRESAPWWSCRRRARRSGSRPAESGRFRTRSRRCGPWPPGRSGRRNWRGGICAPAPGRAGRAAAGRQGRNRPDGRFRDRWAAYGSASIGHRSIRNVCLSKPACGTGSGIERRTRTGPHPARFARKTGRRLTSDPIRTSLGLLPSGPDPVGEWLVHRQSPGPYLGPKAPESKRGRGSGFRAPERSNSSWPGLSRPSTSFFPAAHQKRRGCPA